MGPSNSLHASACYDEYHEIFDLNSILQYRPSATGGACRGRAPPNDCLCPPNENSAPPSNDCAPKKLTRSGLLKCKSRPKLVFATGIFVIFVDWHRISWHFGDEDLFFFGDHLFSAGKTARIPDFGRKISCNFSEDLFLWRSPVFGRKSRLNSRFRPENPLESLVFTLFIWSRLK